MTIWRPKSGRVCTWRRLLHLLVGLVVPWVAFRIGGYGALGFACWGMVIVAGAWEAFTPTLAVPFRWPHPWGDVIDLAAFSSGVSVTGLTLGIACRPT